MDRYTIFCTEEQTKKAFELGAPMVKVQGFVDKYPQVMWISKVGYIVAIPTAEQMLGWLRSQGYRFCINDLEEPTHWESTIDGLFAVGELSAPKEATLAAIDVALDYLIKNKK